MVYGEAYNVDMQGKIIERHPTEEFDYQRLVTRPANVDRSRPENLPVAWSNVAACAASRISPRSRECLQ